ncbi:MAG: DUF4189 domain-containing protein [Candidatus Hydrogenedentes bacterium]|nr:DUF4189 domain-containing protein [Candidatus Hydrogenedentota bacterium]
MEPNIEASRPVTSKLWIKAAACVACAAFVCAETWAAAALAYDTDDGTLGYGIGTDKATSKAAAIDDCESNGATNAKFWFWHQGPGWGASSFSDDGGGAWTIGGALSYSTKKKAKKKAKRECKNNGGTNCQLVDVFHDTVGKKTKKGGKSFHLTSD